MVEFTRHHPGFQLLDSFILKAIKRNPGLSSVSDVEAITSFSAERIVNSLRRMHPEQVAYSGVRNNRGAPLFAPADRELSERAKLVGSRRPIVRGVARLWYIGVQGIRTCDL